MKRIRGGRLAVWIGIVLVCAGSVPCRSQDQVTVTEESGAAYREGLALYEGGDYEAAIDRFRAAFDFDGRNTPALFAEGLASSQMGRNAEAADLFVRVLDRDPDHEKALRALPATLLAAGDSTGAQAAYDRCIAAMPDDSSFHYAKAVLLLMDGDRDGAIPLLEEAARCAPGRPDVLERLMFTYREVGDREAAVGTADAILALDGNHTYARIVRADYNREMGNYREALRDYERAASDAETRAYAEYYAESLRQELEEIEIEQEYQERMERRRRGN